MIMGKQTYIDGIGSSQALDTAGEIVDLRGLDITSLAGSCFNFEHESKLPSQIVGKILEATKIFGPDDCKNERHLYYWNKSHIPFLYIMGRLFDDKKPSSKEVAAMFQDDAEHPNEPDMLGFSVEGAKIEKQGTVITRSIARKVTITALPANKTCIAEALPEKEEKEPDALSSLFKCEVELLKYEPSYEELVAKKEKLEKDSGMGIGTGSEPTGMAGGSGGGGAFIGSQMAMNEEIDKVALENPDKSAGWVKMKAKNNLEKTVPPFKKLPEKGVHTAVNPKKPGESIAGNFARHLTQNPTRKDDLSHMREGLKAGHQNKLAELKAMPKPNLPKSEKIDKAESMEKTIKPMYSTGFHEWSTPRNVMSGPDKGTHYNHPKFGTLSVKQGPDGHTVSHNKQIKGTFKTPEEAKNFTSHFMSSYGKNNKLGKNEELEKAVTGHEKGIHTPSTGKLKNGKHIPSPSEGLSPAGIHARGLYDNTPKDKALSQSKAYHAYVLKEMKGMPSPNLPKSENMKKALTAGSGMAAPGQLEGVAALTKESLEKKSHKVNALQKKEKSHWYSRADEAYNTWGDREKFRTYMKKRMPHLADGEVDAIGRVLALKKNMQAENKLNSMYAKIRKAELESRINFAYQETKNASRIKKEEVSAETADIKESKDLKEKK